MELIPSELTIGAANARNDLSALARREATTNTKAQTPAAQATMASTAQKAIFADALLAAVHARLAEFKSVAR